jgi:hypothetical protein
MGEPQMMKKISSEIKEHKELMNNSDDGTKITLNEDDELITVSWKVYFDYFKEAYFWLLCLLFIIPFIGAACWCWMTLQTITADWMDNFD